MKGGRDFKDPDWVLYVKRNLFQHLLDAFISFRLLLQSVLNGVDFIHIGSDLMPFVLFKSWDTLSGAFYPIFLGLGERLRKVSADKAFLSVCESRRWSAVVVVRVNHCFAFGRVELVFPLVAVAFTDAEQLLEVGS